MKVRAGFTKTQQKDMDLLFYMSWNIVLLTAAHNPNQLIKKVSTGKEDRE